MSDISVFFYFFVIAIAVLCTHIFIVLFIGVLWCQKLHPIH